MTGDDSRDSSSAFGAGSVALERGSSASPRGGHRRREGEGVGRLRKAERA